MAGKIPQRLCIACRQMKDKRTLVRCRVTSEGSVEMDLTGKKSGRGAYICSAPECVAKARKHNLLGKALGAEVSAEVYDGLAALAENDGQN